MKNVRHYFFTLLFLGSLISCNQDNSQAKEEFRQRQQNVQEEATEEHPAPMTGQGGESVTDHPQATPPEEGDTLSEPEASARPATVPGDKVVAVKDGDTFEVLRNGKAVNVRLYGVDAPEKNQDYGQRAKQYASDLAFGKQVKLIEHNKDRYGRTVGTIMLPDGRNLNEMMVRDGYAWHYKAYSKDQNLANAEADARRFKRGLWQDPNPTAPWDFRKGKRDGTASQIIPTSNAPIPAGATKRRVYLCDSSGSAVYHTDENCHVLKRCKAEVLAVTEAAAIREYDRRLDKTCGSK